MKYRNIRIKHNASAGYSLVELMVITGLTGISMLAVTSLMTTMNKSKIYTESSSQLTTIVNQVKQQVANEQKCGDTIGITAPSPYPAPSAFPFPFPTDSPTIVPIPIVLKGFNNVPLINPTPNAMMPGTTVTSLLTLVLPTPVSSMGGYAQYSAVIQINSVNATNAPVQGFGAQGATGGAGKTVEVPINLRVDSSNNIVGCSGGSSSSDASLFMQQCPAGTFLSTTDGNAVQCVAPTGGATP